MRPIGSGVGRFVALALACAVTACGGGDAQTARRVNPTPTAFSAANLDINRPCTLLTSNDAADISSLPFYRTMAANLVEESRIRCAQGVGAYGLHGIVELDMQLASADLSARDIFGRECRVTMNAAPAPPVPAPPAAEFEANEMSAPRIDPTALAAPAAPIPVVNGAHCLVAGGAYALLLPDRVVFLRVRRSAGEIDAAATLRLASLVSFRLTTN